VHIQPYTSSRESDSLLTGARRAIRWTARVARGDLREDSYCTPGKSAATGRVHAIPVTPDVLTRGQDRFNVYCLRLRPLARSTPGGRCRRNRERRAELSCPAGTRRSRVLPSSAPDISSSPASRGAICGSHAPNRLVMTSNRGACRHDVSDGGLKSREAMSRCRRPRGHDNERQ